MERRTSKKKKKNLPTRKRGERRVRNSVLGLVRPGENGGRSLSIKKDVVGTDEKRRTPPPPHPLYQLGDGGGGRVRHSVPVRGFFGKTRREGRTSCNGVVTN